MPGPKSLHKTKEPPPPTSQKGYAPPTRESLRLNTTLTSLILNKEKATFKTNVVKLNDLTKLEAKSSKALSKLRAKANTLCTPAAPQESNVEEQKEEIDDEDPVTHIEGRSYPVTNPLEVNVVETLQTLLSCFTKMVTSCASKPTIMINNVIIKDKHNQEISSKGITQTGSNKAKADKQQDSMPMVIHGSPVVQISKKGKVKGTIHNKSRRSRRPPKVDSEDED